MKVIRDLNEDGNIATNLCSYLTQIKDENNLFFHNEHTLRHPLAHYSIGASRFFEAFRVLCDVVGEQHGNNSNISNLFSPTKDLFDSLMSHLDSVYHIFKCFLPASLVSKNTDVVNEWLARATKNNKSCRQVIAEFRNNISFCDTFRKINNKLKHKNGRINTLSMQGVDGFGFRHHAVGFYVNAVDSNGAELPDREFHKCYKGSTTAYSYNWFILEMFAQFYFIDKYAAHCLRKIILGQHSLDIPSINIYIDSKDIANIYARLSSTLSRLLFPDEHYKEISQVHYNGKILIIKKPADEDFIAMKFSQQGNYTNLEWEARGDGFTKKFYVPYR